MSTKQSLRRPDDPADISLLVLAMRAAEQTTPPKLMTEERYRLSLKIAALTYATK